MVVEHAWWLKSVHSLRNKECTHFNRQQTIGLYEKEYYGLSYAQDTPFLHYCIKVIKVIKLFGNKKLLKPWFYQAFQQFLSCRQRDLNPHVVAHNRFWVCLVCHSDTPAFVYHDASHNEDFHNTLILTQKDYFGKQEINISNFRIISAFSAHVFYNFTPS